MALGISVGAATALLSYGLAESELIRIIISSLRSEPVLAPFAILT